ncbi:exopolysaccharide biosynthesis protein [Lysobacter xanthus]
MTGPAERGRVHGARALLDALAEGDPDEVQPLAGLFRGLGDSAFGMLLLAAAGPAFIPVPGLAGGLSGPLVMLVGVQLLVRMPQPWLPAAIGRRGPKRRTLAKLRDRISPWLGRLERVVRPRAGVLLDHPVAEVFTGLLVLLVGAMLTLPIPFTNYLFGVLVLLFALAFLERDGLLMAAAWVGGIAAAITFGLLSGSIAHAIARYV